MFIHVLSLLSCFMSHETKPIDLIFVFALSAFSYWNCHGGKLTKQQTQERADANRVGFSGQWPNMYVLLLDAGLGRQSSNFDFLVARLPGEQRCLWGLWAHGLVASLLHTLGHLSFRHPLLLPYLLVAVHAWLPTRTVQHWWERKSALHFLFVGSPTFPAWYWPYFSSRSHSGSHCDTKLAASGSLQPTVAGGSGPVAISRPKSSRSTAGTQQPKYWEHRDRSVHCLDGDGLSGDVDREVVWKRCSQSWRRNLQQWYPMIYGDIR